MSDVRIEVAGKPLRSPISYNIDIDLLQPADAFSMTLPLDLQTWDACPLDAEVRVTIDGTPALIGYVDTLRDQGDGSFTVEGRDKTGRLVDESVPGAGMTLGGKLLGEVILELVRPWFERVEFSNAKDRALRRGEGKQARAGREPALTAAQARAIGRRIEAGTTRWEGVERILRPLGLLAWGSADGKTLVVASPNYTQAPQYEFFETVRNGSNVTRLSLTKSTAGRYAQIVASGSGRPLTVDAPKVQTPAGQTRANQVRGNRRAGALDNPSSADGTGLDFLHPKRLFLATEGLTTEEAQREAERVLARGRARSREVEVTVPGHGVVLDGAHQATLYAPDTVATVYKEIEAAPGDDTPETIVNTNFYVTRVNYQGTRDGGESTSLSLVPLESLLV